MKNFKIFSGRYIAKLLVLIPLFIAITYAVGYFIGFFAGETSSDAGNAVQGAVGEIDWGVQYDMAIMFCMLSVLIPIMTTGFFTNFMFRVDGWKYVRTIKNADKKYKKALWINVGLSTLCVLFTIIAFHLVIVFAHGEAISIPALIATMIPAMLGNTICCITMFIRNQTVRIVIVITGIIAVEIGGMFVVRTIINGVMNQTVGIIITAAVALVLLTVTAITTKKISRRWLLD